MKQILHLVPTQSFPNIYLDKNIFQLGSIIYLSTQWNSSFVCFLSSHSGPPSTKTQTFYTIYFLFPANNSFQTTKGLFLLFMRYILVRFYLWPWFQPDILKKERWGYWLLDDTKSSEAGLTLITARLYLTFRLLIFFIFFSGAWCHLASFYFMWQVFVKFPHIYTAESLFILHHHHHDSCNRHHHCHPNNCHHRHNNFW